MRASTSVGEGTPSGTDIALADETSKMFNVTMVGQGSTVFEIFEGTAVVTYGFLNAI